jgi:hypothetical protein
MAERSTAAPKSSQSFVNHDVLFEAGQFVTPLW